MKLGRVIGTVVANTKADGMDGLKLLVVRPLTSALEPAGMPFVATDASDQAGEGTLVTYEASREAALLETLGEPLMSSTLLLPGDELPLSDPREILERLQSQVDLVIDGGYCGLEPTTVVDLTGETPNVLRHGRGDVSVLSP